MAEELYVEQFRIIRCFGFNREEKHGPMTAAVEIEGEKGIRNILLSDFTEDQITQLRRMAGVMTHDEMVKKTAVQQPKPKTGYTLIDPIHGPYETEDTLITDPTGHNVPDPSNSTHYEAPEATARKKRTIPQDPVAHAITMIHRASLKKNERINKAEAACDAKIEELNQELDDFVKTTIAALEPEAAELVARYLDADKKKTSR